MLKTSWCFWHQMFMAHNLIRTPTEPSDATECFNFISDVKHHSLQLRSSELSPQSSSPSHLHLSGMQRWLSQRKSPLGSQDSSSRREAGAWNWLSRLTQYTVSKWSALMGLQKILFSVFNLRTSRVPWLAKHFSPSGIKYEAKLEYLEGKIQLWAMMMHELHFYSKFHSQEKTQYAQ